jgi:Dyp-type peroxidase family
MTKLDLSDIQGNVLRGYGFPFGHYVFLRIEHARKGQEFVGAMSQIVMNAEIWRNGKPNDTVNIAFSYRGLTALDLPAATLQSSPVEFVQGMKARDRILGDTGRSAPGHWDEIWRRGDIHVMLAIHGQSTDACRQRAAWLDETIAKIGGVEMLGCQDAAALMVDGQGTRKEHFGYTDGFGNPYVDGDVLPAAPGMGKIVPNGGWAPLATGEVLLGYPDESEELPVSPVPYLLGRNGTFMVYRKLHQNVATFRRYLNEMAPLYAGGKEMLAAKFVGRWRDGTPLELSPMRMDAALVADDNRNNNFTYGADGDGVRCPLGSHIRRTNPRDAFGFNGALINRRRILRRGLPYGEYTPDDQPGSDDAEHGIIFMALNASFARQFEFVQQQWIQYGNDAHQGNDKDVLLGNHNGHGKMMIQGVADGGPPPFLCGHLPSFVETRGGEYFFVPSLTALRLIAGGAVDPR